MENKKVLIIGGLIFLVVVGSAAGYFLLRKRTSPQFKNGLTGESKSTGTGELANLPPLKNTMPAIIDQSRPFATNSPRSVEPGALQSPVSEPVDRTTTGQSSQTLHQRAIEQGLLPDKDGLYRQTVDPSGINLYMASNLERGLSNEHYLAKYYPNAREQLMSFARGSGDDTIVQDTPQDNRAQSVPEVPEVDKRLFRINNDNSRQTYAKYMEDLASAVSGLDIFTPDKFVATVESSNPNDVRNKADEISRRILSIPVNSKMLGLSMAYYDSYQKLIVLMDSARQRNEEQAQRHTTDLILSMQRASQNLLVAKNILEALGYTR